LHHERGLYAGSHAHLCGCRGLKHFLHKQSCAKPTSTRREKMQRAVYAPEPGRAGQGKARQGRAGQGQTGQGRAGQGRAGQGRAGQGRAGQGRYLYIVHIA